jgi:hypothetical protein
MIGRVWMAWTVRAGALDALPAWDRWRFRRVASPAKSQTA